MSKREETRKEYTILLSCGDKTSRQISCLPRIKDLKFRVTPEKQAKSFISMTEMVVCGWTHCLLQESAIDSLGEEDYQYYLTPVTLVLETVGCILIGNTIVPCAALTHINSIFGGLTLLLLPFVVHLSFYINDLKANEEAWSSTAYHRQ